MQNEVVVVKKGNRFLKVLGILLAIGALCYAAVKIYNKYFRKETLALDAEDASADEVALEDATEEAAVAEEAFEVPAEAVIANAEQMEA